MSAFLTPDQVEQLTGYKKPAKQIGWLCRNAIPHYVNRQGRPVVPQDLTKQVNAPSLGEVR